MSVASPVLPDFTSQDAATYKARLDGAAKAYLRTAGAFAPRADVQFAFTAAKVDAAANKITRENHTLLDGDKVRLSTTGTLPAPLAAATDYWIVGRTDDTFQLSTTQGGAAIDLADGGSGIHTLTRTLDMSFALGAGFIPAVGALAGEVAPQKIGPLAAPATNPRYDLAYIDARTGVAAVATGTEAASPAIPAPPAGKLPICAALLAAGQTAIADADLLDLRALGFAGLGTAAQKDTGTGAANVPTKADADTLYLAQGKHTIWVPAAAIRPYAVSGAAPLAAFNNSAGRPEIHYLAFDAAVQENAGFSIAMPKSYSGGPIEAAPVWTTDTASAGNVLWMLQAVSFGSGEALDVPFTTTIMSWTSANPGQKLLKIEAFASGTPEGTPAGGERVFFRFFRQAGDAADTLAADAWLLGVVLKIPLNAKDDA